MNRLIDKTIVKEYGGIFATSIKHHREEKQRQKFALELPKDNPQEEDEKPAILHPKNPKIAENTIFYSYAKRTMSSFEKYAKDIEKISYVRCKENLVEYLNENSEFRQIIIDKVSWWILKLLTINKILGH